MQSNPLELNAVFQINEQREKQIDDFVKFQSPLLQRGGRLAMYATRAIVEYCQNKNESAYAFTLVGGYLQSVKI